VHGVGEGKLGGKIVQLGTTRLVPRKVVSVPRHQDRLQDRMVGIHSGVDVRDNPRSRHTERLLRVLHTHNRRRRLIDVAVPTPSARWNLQGRVLEFLSCRSVLGIVEGTRFVQIINQVST